MAWSFSSPRWTFVWLPSAVFNSKTELSLSWHNREIPKAGSLAWPSACTRSGTFCLWRVCYSCNVTQAEGAAVKIALFTTVCSLVGVPQCARGGCIRSRWYLERIEKAPAVLLKRKMVRLLFPNYELHKYVLSFKWQLQLDIQCSSDNGVCC